VSRWTKTEYKAQASDERGNVSAKVHIHQRCKGVDSATVRGRRLSLPQRSVPCRFATENAQGILTAGQKSAEGVLGYVVGKASEALHAERRRSTDSRAGER